MAKGNKRINIKLKSSESSYCYYTTKKPKTTQRLTLKKYDPIVRKHVVFKEAK
jgi:large subunit ribosomal protein L33